MLVPNFRLVVPLILALAWSQADAAQQVELHLTSGQIVTGELVSEDADKVVVKSTLTTKNGKPMSISKEYQRGELTELVRLQEPEDAYQTRSAAAKTAEDHATLAAWCRGQSMIDRAVEHARQALTLDPKQDAAAKLLGELGWVQADGAWVNEADWLAKQGKVRFQGKVMTLAEADALKAQLRLQQTQKQAQQAVDDKTATIAALDRRIADLPKRPAAIDSEMAKAKADLATAEAAAQRVTTAKTALDQAQKQLADAQTAARSSTPSGGPGRQPSGPGSMPSNQAPTQNLVPLQQAVDDAQKAYTTARHDSSAADQDAARLKARIAALTDEKQNLAKKGDELKAQRETMVKELEQLKAALADATKATAAAATPPAAPSP